MIITSRDNKTVALVRKLAQKKYREEYGLFVAEGLRTVSDITAFAPELVDQVLVTTARASAFPDAVVVDDRVFESMSDTMHSQGVLAVLRIPELRPRDNGYALFLDGVRDPGNVGTLIRTACAAGYGDVYLKDCADAYSGKVVRSTMSAIVKVGIHAAHVGTVDTLRSDGYTVIGADMDGRDIYGIAANAYDKVCVVVGGEANGISEEIRSKCDDMISIPMEGDIESLNAAVSGALMMYQLKFNKINK